jgi:LysR family transcriptional regulator, chromosome initiation inhibitor
LQKRFLRKMNRTDIDPPAHIVPHGGAFVRACTSGLAWGMCPQRLIAGELENGTLVDIAPATRLDIDLYWQSWRMAFGWLDDFSAMLKLQARHYLG